MSLAGIQTLLSRRNAFAQNLFNKISNEPKHKLYSLLPQRNQCHVNLRRRRNLAVSVCKTKQFQNSFFFIFCIIAFTLIVSIIFLFFFVFPFCYCKWNIIQLVSAMFFLLLTIYLTIYLSIYLSIQLSIYPSILYSRTKGRQQLNMI